MLADDAGHRRRLGVAETGGDETTIDVGVREARVRLVTRPRVGDPGRSLIIGRLHVEERARHHRHRGGDRAGAAGQQHGAGIRGRDGHAEDQTEDRDRPVLHTENDGAHRGEEGVADPTGQRRGPIRRNLALARGRTTRRGGVLVPRFPRGDVGHRGIPCLVVVDLDRLGTSKGRPDRAPPRVAVNRCMPELKGRPVITRANTTTGAIAFTAARSRDGLSDEAIHRSIKERTLAKWWTPAATL